MNRPLLAQPANPATERFEIGCPICGQVVSIEGMSGYETFARHYKPGSNLSCCAASAERIDKSLLVHRQPVRKLGSTRRR